MESLKDLINCGTGLECDVRYFNTSQLTDKSDVFSFGVVLMEILCGREPLSSDCAPEEYNLVAWVLNSLPYLPFNISHNSKRLLRSESSVPASRPSSMEVLFEMCVIYVVYSYTSKLKLY